MALTPLKAWRLDAGIKGWIKRGNQGGRVKTSIGISMFEAGSVGWPDAARRSGDVSEIGRCGKGMNLMGGAHMAVM
jgi:hypothetical protein